MPGVGVQAGAPGREHLLVVGFLLGKDPDAEVPVLVGLEGGRHQDVLPGRQLEPVEHLAQIDEGVGPLPCSVGQEEVSAEVDVGLSSHLVDKQKPVGADGKKSPGSASFSLLEMATTQTLHRKNKCPQGRLRTRAAGALRAAGSAETSHLHTE